MKENVFVYQKKKKKKISFPSRENFHSPTWKVEDEESSDPCHQTKMKARCVGDLAEI